MSTAPTIVNQAIKHTVVRGVCWGLIASACAVPWNTNTSNLFRYGTTGEHSPEIRRWEEASRKRAQHANASQLVDQWLHELEQHLRLTRSGLAALLGVSRPTLYSWARGKGLRDNNAERLQALRAAADILVAGAPSGILPALWQHQRLPAHGMSFMQGMVAGRDPDAMAREIVKMWAHNALESSAFEHLSLARICGAI